MNAVYKAAWLAAVMTVTPIAASAQDQARVYDQGGVVAVTLIDVEPGQFDAYMELLKNAYQPENLEAVMCRTLVSVDWQGYLYDCDFNQMLGLPLAIDGRARTHVRDLMGIDLSGHPIVVKDHCYGCTAGQGSSCGGALS